MSEVKPYSQRTLSEEADRLHQIAEQENLSSVLAEACLEEYKLQQTYPSLFNVNEYDNAVMRAFQEASNFVDYEMPGKKLIPGSHLNEYRKKAFLSQYSPSGIAERNEEEIADWLEVTIQQYPTYVVFPWLNHTKYSDGYIVDETILGKIFEADINLEYPERKQ